MNEVERNIRFEIGDSSVVLRFVWEYGHWVCRADNEFIEDLSEMVGEKI